MNAITSFVANAVVCAALAATLSACAPVLALVPLGVGVSLIALDGDSHTERQASTVPAERPQN
jgi:hypothetical protein